MDNENCGEFGMLVVDPSCQSGGVGRKLGEAAEEWASQKGFKETQLEILTPRTWKRSHQRNLPLAGTSVWVTNLSELTGSKKDFGHLTELMATPCDFTIFRKPLSC